MIPALMIRIFGDDWKTSLAGVLSALSVTLATVTGILTATQGIHVAASVMLGLTMASNLCRVWLGLISKDAK